MIKNEMAVQIYQKSCPIKMGTLYMPNSFWFHKKNRVTKPGYQLAHKKLKQLSSILFNSFNMAFRCHALIVCQISTFHRLMQ